jgi:uncharacterized protein (DUF433 family)
VARTTKGEPFSVRFSAATDRAIEAEAKRLKRSKSVIVEALADEAMKMRRFPGIAFRGDDAGRRPWVIGSGIDVWEIVDMLDDFGGSIEALVKDYDFLTEQHVRLATAYHAAYPEEIDEAIAENRRPPEERLELYPFVQFVRPA